MRSIPTALPMQTPMQRPTENACASMCRDGRAMAPPNNNAAHAMPAWKGCADHSREKRTSANTAEEKQHRQRWNFLSAVNKRQKATLPSASLRFKTRHQNGSTWIRFPSRRTSADPASLSCKSRVLTLATPAKSLPLGPGTIRIRVTVLPIHFPF